MLVALGVLEVAALEAGTVRVMELRELQIQAGAVAADMAVHQLLRLVQADQALLLFPHHKRRHLPQALQQLQLAAAEQSTLLLLPAQLHSKITP
jgi:hypothetical protein